MFKKLLIVLMIGAIGYTGYWTHRIYNFVKAQQKWDEHIAAAVDCMVQENGQAETDINVLFKGYKSREAYAKAVNKTYPGVYPPNSAFLNRKMYNEQIPECHKYYAYYRCWMLDVHDPLSLDGCGKHFGLTQEEIDEMKKYQSDYKKVNELSNKAWNRRSKENHDKNGT